MGFITNDELSSAIDKKGVSLRVQNVYNLASKSRKQIL